MKKLMVIVAAIAAFITVGFSQEKTALAGVQLEQFTVVGKKLSIKDYDLVGKVNYEKVLLEHKKNQGPGRDFMLMKVTADQWTLLQQRGVKLKSLWEGDTNRDWIDLKFGNIGPILTECDGKPGFTLKTSKGDWTWTYDTQEIMEEVPFFWIMIDVRASYRSDMKG